MTYPKKPKMLTVLLESINELLLHWQHEKCLEEACTLPFYITTYIIIAN